VAPVFRMNEMKGKEGQVDSPGLVTACVCLWVQAIVRGVGIGYFLAGHGGAAVVGGHWRSWAVMKGSGGDECCWWW